MYHTELKHPAGLVLLLEKKKKNTMLEMRVSGIQVNSEDRWEIRANVLVPFIFSVAIRHALGNAPQDTYECYQLITSCCL